MRRFIHIFIVACVALTSCSAYKKIHRQAIVVDTHNDIISTSLEKNLSFDNDLSGKTHSDLQRMLKGGLDVQVFSIFCDGKQEHPFAFANREIDTLYSWVQRNPGKMMLVTSPEALRAAVAQKKLGAMIGVEGGHMIEDDLQKLQQLYDRGARYLTLTWNNSNHWATSAEEESDTTKHLQHKGLTSFGKQVIEKMNELGMMIDVSHVGEQTFWDAIKYSKKPLIASHSSVYAIAPVFRNLKDDQIKAIAQNGGVVQINFYPLFLDAQAGAKQRSFFRKHREERKQLMAAGATGFEADEKLANLYPAEAAAMQTPLETVINHINYIVQLVGEDYVGLGGDFDGISFTPLQLTDVTKYPVITKALLKEGYNRQQVNKILGGNFIRVFTANQPQPTMH